MDNPEKLATQVTQDKEKQKKTQHIMCRTSPHAKNTNNTSPPPVNKPNIVSMHHINAA
jgi:hypothetical protein